MCKKTVLSVLILIRNSSGHLDGLLTETVSFGAFDSSPFFHAIFTYREEIILVQTLPVCQSYFQGNILRKSDLLKRNLKKMGNKTEENKLKGTESKNELGVG